MSKRDALFHLPDGTVAYLEMNSIGKILADKGLDPEGKAQAFHTQNVLRRITRYMPFRSGLTIKVTIAQTDIKKPEIVTDTLFAKKLHEGVDKNGKPLHYTKTKNPRAGPYWEKALSAAEGKAMAADLQRYISRR